MSATVTDLLDQTRRDYLDDYTEMVSGETDQLIRDSSLVRWFNEAENRICSETLCLKSFGPRDSAITQITLVTGQQDYAVDSRVIRILSARLNDTEYDLGRARYEDIRESAARYYDNEYWDINTPATVSPGRPSWFSTDTQTGLIRFKPTPSSAENGLIVNLRVAHYPINVMSTATPNAEPEIPDQFHYLLPLYAAARAFSGFNVDIQNNNLSRAFMRDFEFGLQQFRRHQHIADMSSRLFRFGGWADGS